MKFKKTMNRKLLGSNRETKTKEKWLKREKRIAKKNEVNEMKAGGRTTKQYEQQEQKNEEEKKISVRKKNERDFILFVLIK
jgi:hypothetical protein